MVNVAKGKGHMSAPQGQVGAAALAGAAAQPSAGGAPTEGGALTLTAPCAQPAQAREGSADAAGPPRTSGAGPLPLRDRVAYVAACTVRDTRVARVQQKGQLLSPITFVRAL